MNVNFTALSYEVLYSVSARNAVLLPDVMMAYDSSMSGMYNVLIQNEAIFVSGVMVTVNVRAVNGTMQGPVTTLMANASGGELSLSLSLSSLPLRLFLFPPHNVYPHAPHPSSLIPYLQP